MGNCVFKGFNYGDDMMVKVVTSNGGIMELYAPITVECITNEFPGHGIFRRSRPGFFSEPMLHSDELLPGELYYLLPLETCGLSSSGKSMARKQADESAANLTPYRMFTYDKNSHGGGKMGSSEAEVVPRYNGSGVWKVKLVISPEQLSDILSQESRTEALIESVRTVAKCGNGLPSAVNSDKWSVSGSWKGSLSEKMAFDS
ncbi:uncharacterized protein LOC129291817 [Prosopis cineraria]|uniref:uncharacterized protein LOC129291817 n=1 Tax=Prosopis cineraria TaxID=364024 RepID=UPI00240F0467|nr:uncharacterized protein LOC129291817 [Prosopis cineraria]